MQALGVSGMRIRLSAYLNLQNIPAAPIYILSNAQFDPIILQM